MDGELLAGVGGDAGASNDGVRAHHLLVVVDVGGALGAVVAVDGVACDGSHCQSLAQCWWEVMDG